MGNVIMKNTEIAERARQTIEIVTVKLDQRLIKSRFDEPVAKAAEQFEFEATFPITHIAFHKIISGFVEYIYENAFGASWMLTDPLAEAMFLLENHYRSEIYGTGYTAAILDADDTAESGIQTVLSGLAEAIKDVERQKYVRGVFAWHVLGADWNLRCEIARILLEDYKLFMPERLCKCVPAQLVDQIPAIMNIHICSDSTLQQITFCRETPLTAETLTESQLL